MAHTQIKTSIQVVLQAKYFKYGFCRCSSTEASFFITLPLDSQGEIAMLCWSLVVAMFACAELWSVLLEFFSLLFCPSSLVGRSSPELLDEIIEGGSSLGANNVASLVSHFCCDKGMLNITLQVANRAVFTSNTCGFSCNEFQSMHTK